MKNTLPLLVVVALALLLRVVNLGSVPYWDWDEGGNLNYATNLAGGYVQFFAYKYHFMSHPPLYFMFLAVWFKLFGATIHSIRLFSVACSMAGLVLVYSLVSRFLAEKTAIFSVMIYAVYPELVFWGRMGFANNLLGVLAVASMYYIILFLKGRNTRDLLLSGFLSGLCAITEYTGFIFVVAFAIVLYLFSRESLLKGISAAAVPPMLFAGYIILFDLNGFQKDLGASVGLYPLAVPLIVLAVALFGGFSKYVLAYFDSLDLSIGKETPAELFVFVILCLLSIAPLDSLSIFSGKMTYAFILMSLLGILFIPDRVLRTTLLSFAMGYSLLLVAINRWDHMSIPLHYVISCAPVFFLQKVGAYLRPRMPTIWVAVLALPLITAFWVDYGAFAANGLCSAPVADFGMLNDFINQRTTSDDVVATYSYLAPGLNAKTTIMETVLPYNGLPFAYNRRKYDQSEYVLNLSTENIKYFVLPAGYIEARDDPVNVKLRNWTAIYRLYQRQVRTEPSAPFGLRFFGGSEICAGEYVVLENPNYGK